MAETPSKRRRKGREAFEPNCDPMDLQPYKPDTYSYNCHLSDWMDGWREAERAKEKEDKEAEKEKAWKEHERS